MADCSFSIPFQGSPDKMINKAKAAVQSQGGTFNGDNNAGNFQVSVFGNSIAGSYTVSAMNLDIVIDSKPFLIPCSAIESFLRKQVEG